MGNYFHSRDISGLIMCVTGQIRVKYDNSKLKKQAFAGRMWPAGRMLPPPALAAELSQILFFSKDIFLQSKYSFLPPSKLWSKLHFKKDDEKNMVVKKSKYRFSKYVSI